jgi:hypothetical protein
MEQGAQKSVGGGVFFLCIFERDPGWGYVWGYQLNDVFLLYGYRIPLSISRY